MPRFAAVAVNIPTQQDLFHYHIPATLSDKIVPGHLVEVPFGNQIAQGVVFELLDQPEVAETRPILKLVDADVILTSAQIQLARWMSENTLAPLATCLQVMLPPGLTRQTDTLYVPRHGSATVTLNALQTRLIRLLHQRGPLRGRQIDVAIPRLDWRPAARHLMQLGLIETRPVLPAPTIRPKMVRAVVLACSPAEAEQAMPRLARQNSKALARRQAMLRYLLAENGAVEATWLYAASGGNLSDLYALAEQGLIRLSEAKIWRDPLAELHYPLHAPLALTPDQQRVWEVIRQGLEAAAQGQPVPTHLLHGVTGSGKTEIYLYAVQETLRLGRQALILVPEIAMTPQTVRRFVARFPGQVGIYHSGLSEGERYDTWMRARLGQIAILIGTRSALFAPFNRLGLIVLDESHDDSYYQMENAPHYHACETANAYARLAGALCVLGTATPTIESRFRADLNEWRYLRLPARLLAHRQAIQNQMQRLAKHQKAPRYQPASGEAETTELPPVTVVDMRQELKDGNRSIFSRCLQAALRQVLQSEEQAILFLNRRGAATHVFCRDCGYVVKCRRCDIPMTFHSEFQQHKNILLCHRCNERRNAPERCPECGGRNIRHLGAGTQRVEEEALRLFPQARTLRWDYETTRSKGAHEIILRHFSNHQADILIGTQMVAKSLDLPLVTLVGIVLADVGLNLPDLRAAERTFQVLTQVAGRAGRSPLGGRVILQTFQPDHYVIQAAARHDYDQFYQRELSQRKALGYPPFSKMVRLEYRHYDPLRAEQAAQTLAKTIKGWIETEKRAETQLIGPAPCFFARQDGVYRWQIILFGPDPAAILRGRSLGDWRVEVNPVSLL